MIYDILINIAAALIASAAIAFYKRIRKSATENENHRQKPQNQKYSKKLIKDQFYICLGTAAVTSIALASLRLGEPYNAAGVVKMIAGIFFYFSLFFMWGAFDAALAFVPEDDDHAPERKTDHPTDGGGDHCAP